MHNLETFVVTIRGEDSELIQMIRREIVFEDTFRCMNRQHKSLKDFLADVIDISEDQTILSARCNGTTGVYTFMSILMSHFDVECKIRGVSGKIHGIKQSTDGPFYRVTEEAMPEITEGVKHVQI